MVAPIQYPIDKSSIEITCPPNGPCITEQEIFKYIECSTDANDYADHYVTKVNVRFHIHQVLISLCELLCSAMVILLFQISLRVYSH